MDKELMSILGDSERVQVVEELRAHLEACADDLRLEGEVDAERQAVLRFGQHEELARGFAVAERSAQQATAARHAVGLAAVVVFLPVLADLLADAQSFFLGADFRITLVMVPMALALVGWTLLCARSRRWLVVPMAMVVFLGWGVSTLFGGWTRTVNGDVTWARGTTYQRVKGMRESSLPSLERAKQDLERGYLASRDPQTALRALDGLLPGDRVSLGWGSYGVSLDAGSKPRGRYVAPALMPLPSGLDPQGPQADLYRFENGVFVTVGSYDEARTIWQTQGPEFLRLGTRAIQIQKAELAHEEAVLHASWWESVRHQNLLKVSLATVGFFLLLLLNAIAVLGAAVSERLSGNRERLTPQ